MFKDVSRFCFLAGLSLGMAQVSFGGPFGLLGGKNRGGNGNGAQSAPVAVQPVAVHSDGELLTCQGVANRMARLGVMRHFSNPTGGFEGVGCSSAGPEAALANTCRPRSGGPPRDWGVCQGANGLWYACRRW